MQSGKFSASREAVLINAAGVVLQKMTWNGIHDHQWAVLAFFNKACIKIGTAHAQVRSGSIGFWSGDVHHQAFTAIATVGTTDFRADFGLQPVYRFVDGFAFMIGQKGFEQVIFPDFFCGQLGHPAEIGFGL